MTNKEKKTSEGEGDLSENETVPEGDFLVVPSKKAISNDFFKALHKFQYGEGEESNEGFEKMRELAVSDQEETEIDED